jgi:hypothetical protein
VKKPTPFFILLMILLSLLISIPRIALARTYDYIYIREDGNIDPFTAPIQRSGDTYTLNENSSISLIIEKDDVVLEVQASPSKDQDLGIHLHKST